MTQITLPERLDSAALPEFIQSLRSHEGGDLSLDASELKHIGAQAFQALIVAANDWQDAGHRLKLENVVSEVEEQLRLLGTSSSVLTEGDIR